MLLFAGLCGVLAATVASGVECDSVKSIRERDIVKVCSSFDDEKTFCGMAARSMRLGGQRFTVPCTYDVETHHCRENYMCNVAESDEWNKSKKSGKKGYEKKNQKAKKTKAKDMRRRVDGDEDCEDAEELVETRTNLNCYNQFGYDECEGGYTNKTMGGEYFYVPCMWSEMCTEDINCAVLAPKPVNRTTDAPTWEPTESPTPLPTPSPTRKPTATPSRQPTLSPSASPTLAPSGCPTLMPSLSPSLAPSESPSQSPSLSPSASPTQEPTPTPTKQPTETPTKSPTPTPTESPVPETAKPSVRPTRYPSAPPTQACSDYRWSRDLDNLSGYEKNNGDWVKDGTCCHPDCPICSNNRNKCTGQVSATGVELPDHLCCRDEIMSDDQNLCSIKGEAPCYYEDNTIPDCAAVTSKKPCRKLDGCSWGGGLCFNDISFIGGEFQETCPCIEIDVCTPASLATAAIIVFDETKYLTMIQYENDFNEEYGDADPEDEKIPGYQISLLLDGVLTPWDFLIWYQTAGCDAGIFSDVTTPPVHVCLTKTMQSFHVIPDARFEGFQNGLTKKRLAQQKTDNFLACFENMVAREFEKPLQMVTWEIDTDNRADNRCFAYKSTDTTFGKPKDSNRRAVSYILEEEWGCPEFNNRKNCGKEDFDGYLMNLRVDDVGTTDSKCMCELMCKDRDWQDKYIAWTWNAYEGKCICAYHAKKNKNNGKYIGTPRWNNLTGMMNGNTFEIQTL